MKHHRTLIITSLLAMLFGTFHLTDDLVRGFEKGGPSTYLGIVILAVWLYATLALSDRRLGLVIMFLGAAGSAMVPYIHMGGAGLVGGRIANSSGMFFWVFTHLVLGATALVSAMLAAGEIWSLSVKSSAT